MTELGRQSPRKLKEVDFVNRHDISLLQTIQGYPALSILLPTHRTSPDNRQDPIRVKNLATEAADRLLKEFSKREIQPLLDKLDAIVREIDYRYALDGLAIYVNQDFARKFYLPFTLKQRVVLDENFATRDLVFAMNRTARYWVLALSEKPTRLYEGTKDTLIEITDYGFPMVHGGPGGESALPGGQGVRKSAYRDEYHRKFFRDVDANFSQIAKEDPLPLMLVGVDRNLAFFNEVIGNRGLVVSSLTGSHDSTPPHDLGKLVWPLVKENLAQRRQGVLKELDAAIGAQRYVSTIGEAWRLAHEGRGALLLVEEDFHYPARVDASGMILTPADDITAPDVMDDAVDDLIEAVLHKGGRVVFTDDGALAAHSQVALILRY
jgi:hypothetical protein